LNSLPRSGAFALARDIYRERRLSELLLRLSAESAREVFYFLCGVCWRLFVNTDDLPRRVGILFLVYLFYHSQHPLQYDVPVDVVVLEALAGMREECERRRVLLDCPAVLHRLCTQGALSVGIRATYRELFFDLSGCLGERSETPAKRRAERSRSTDASGSRCRVKAGRVSIIAEDAVAEADVHPQRALVPASCTPGGMEASKSDLSLGTVLQDGQNIYASLGADAGLGATENQVQGMGKHLARYKHDTPPELLELPGEEALDVEPAQVPKRRRGRGPKLQRELVDQESASGSEGEGGLEPQQGHAKSHGGERVRALGAAGVLRRRAQRERLAEPLAPPREAAGQSAVVASAGSGAASSSCSSIPANSSTVDAVQDDAAAELEGRETEQGDEDQGEEDRSSEGSAGPAPHVDTEWEAMSGSSGMDEESELDE